MQILSVASEVFPLVKTGGLADVAGALPGALKSHDCHFTTLIPGYPAVKAALKKVQPVHKFVDLFGGSAQLLAGEASGLQLFALDAPHLFDRPGNPYIGPDGRDWPDNPIRFAALAWVAAEIGRGSLPHYHPDIIHAHDWQAGLVPAYLRYGPACAKRTGVVFSVHNMAFQGWYPMAMLAQLRLPAESYNLDGIETYGGIGFLKAGLQLADRLTTVSPSYAREVHEAAFGMGMEGVLRFRGADFSGILNGLDTEIWNPSTDPHLAATYGPKAFAKARAANKKALQKRAGLQQSAKRLLFGVVSRLSDQKGLDLLLEALPTLRALDAQLVLLGSGARELESGFTMAAQAFAKDIACTIGYDEDLAHQIQGGSDALLVPSRFEPCGLTQLSALRYGTLPVVARIGGLADTIIDANEMALEAGVATGVQFAPVTRSALEAALQRTAALWQDKKSWRSMQVNAMACDVSWERPAQHYADLYRALAQTL